MTHLHLRTLRTPPGQPRKFPTGLGFDQIVCANYFWETLQVIGMVIMSGFDLGSESVSRAVRDLHYTIRSQLAISRYVSVSVPINNVASSPARTPLNHSQTSCTSVSPRTLWVVGPARSTADTRRSSTQRSTRASGGRCSLSSISRVSHRRLVRRVGISPPHCTHVRPQSRKMRFARVLFWYPFKESPADLHREAKHATAEWRQSRWKVQKHNFTRWIMILRPSKGYNSCTHVLMPAAPHAAHFVLAPSSNFACLSSRRFTASSSALAHAGSTSDSS